jgi:hypothetical protein
VKPDQRDRILAAIDKASSQLNGIDLETSMATANRLFGRLAERTAQMQTREQIVEAFDDFPDVSLKDEMLIRAACRYAPQLLRIAAAGLAEIAKEEFPQIPGGGRPHALNEDEANDVCEYIGARLPKMLFPNAVLLASRRFNVSKRTIERAWSERLEPRDQTVEPTFSEVRDVVKGFVTQLESAEPTTELKAQDQLHGNTRTQKN